ncbi:MAG: sigma-70 family RNA polymerase sigma factor, partial [Planctomycetes bacterium]|nr:sigma-70 family RNA polymerase sigma factor [Planctomycetota bacterium]
MSTLSETDRRRLESLAQDCAERAWRLATGLMGSAGEAEDLVQDGLRIVAGKAAAIPDGDPWPWFSRILVYESRNLRRRSRSHGVLPESRSRTEEPVDIVIDGELQRRFGLALAELVPAEREALLLVHGAGLSLREASAVLEVPRSTLSERVQRAVAKLRRSLSLDERAVVAWVAFGHGVGPAGGLVVASGRWCAEALHAGSPSFWFVGALAVKKILALCGLLAALFVWYLADSAPSRRVEGDPDEGSASGRSQAAVDARRASTKPTVDAVGPPDSPAIATSSPTAPFRFQVEGRVVDSSDEGIAGVRLTIHGVGDPRLSGEAGRPPEFIGEARSKVGGSFHLEVDHPDGDGEESAPFRIQIAAEGYVTMTTTDLFAVRGADLTGLQLRMYRGGRITGRIVDSSTRRPLTGRVMVRGDLPPGSKPMSSAVGTASVPSAADGSFAVNELPPGRWSLTARAVNDEDEVILGLLSDHCDVSLEEGGQVEGVDLPLPSGVLRFGLDGIMPTSLLVEVAGEGFDQGLGIGTSNDGSYLIPGIDTRVGLVRIRAQGYLPWQREVTVRDGGLDLGLIELDEGHRLVGHVEDEMGQLVSGVQIEVGDAQRS